MKEGISVIICCFNSEKRIVPTLEHLCKQDFQGDWEVILVDNNCTDETVNTALYTWKKFNLEIPLVIVREERPGLSYARKRGVEESNGDLIVFCDDDNWLFPDYLKISRSILISDQEIGVLGGKSIPKLQQNEPLWFEKYKENYAVGKQGLQSGDISLRKYIWGSGMIIRKALYAKILNYGYLSKLSDRVGNKLSSGGDTEICILYLLCGFKLWYDDRLQFYHFISSDRLTIEYRERLISGLKESSKVLHQYFRIIEYIRADKNIFQRIVEGITMTGKFILRLISFRCSKNNLKYYISQLQLIFGKNLNIYPSFHELLIIRDHFKR